MAIAPSGSPSPTHPATVRRPPATVNVDPVNDPPALDLNGAGAGTDFSTAYTENGTPVSISDGAVDLSDLDDTAMSSLTFAVGGILDGDSEVLTIGGVDFTLGTADTQTVTVGGTTFQVVYDGAGGFTITDNGGGDMPLADVESLLAGTTYQNTSDDPSDGDRTIEITVTDPAGTSAAATSTVNVDPVNDGPALDLNGAAAGTDFAATYTEDAAPVNIVDGAVDLSDLDDTAMSSVSFSVAGILDEDSEVLSIGGVEFSLGTADTQTMTIGGTIFQVVYDGAGGFAISENGGGDMPLADVESLLAGTTYQNTSVLPTEGNRTIDVITNDGDVNSNQPTTTISVLRNIETAEFSVSGPASVTEGISAGYTINLSGSLSTGENASIDLVLSDIETTAADYGSFDNAVQNAVTAYNVGGNPGSLAWDGATFTFTSDGTGPMSALTINLATNSDSTYEGNERYRISTANPDSTTGVTVSLDTANDGVVTTLLDSDPPPTVTIGNGVAAEGDPLVFDIMLSSVSVEDVTLHLATSSGSATDGVDYENTGFEYWDGMSWVAATNGTEVTIAAGETSLQVRVDTTLDGTVEGSESFTLSVASVLSGTAGDTSDTGTGTITDDDLPALSVNDVTVDEDVGTLTFIVSLDQAPVAPVAVDYATSSGTATQGTDFVGTSGSLLFALGETSQTITVNITNDPLFEQSEQFNVTLSNESGATIADGVGSGTIIDDGSGPAGTDDDRPNLIVPDVAVTEGTNPHAVFTVSLSNASTQDVVIGVGLADGTATGGGIDFGAGLEYFDGASWQPVTGDLSIAAGSTNLQVRTTITDDALADGGETFSLIATRVSGITTNNSDVGTATINDDPTPDTTLVSLVGAATVTEGSNASYTVNIDQTPATAVTLTFAYSGTAANGSDFTGVASVTIPGGGTSATFDIATIDDALFEGDEDFVITIDSVTGGSLEAVAIHPTDNQITTMIIDDDVPTVSVDDVTVSEGDDLYAEFTIGLTNASVEDVSFNVSLTDGTALGSGTDYGTSGAGNLQVFDSGAWVDAGVATIFAGDTSVRVRTPITDDFLADAGETFTATATVASGTTANSSATGTGTINDNSIPSTAIVSLTGPSLVVEGDTTTPYTLVVDATPVEDITVTLNYSGTATDGSDFAGVATVIIPAGLTSATFTLDALDDALYEGDETIVIDIESITGGGFEAIAADPGNNQLITTITDAADIPTVSVNDVTSIEGTDDYAVFTVELSNVSVEDVAVNLSLADVTALGGGTDYGTAGAGNLQVFDGSSWNDAATATIAAGQMAVQVRVPIVNDTTDEPNEDFTLSVAVTAGTTTNASVTGNGTIVDNDPAPNVVIDDAISDEGDPLVFDVTLSNPSSQDIVLDLSTIGNTATDGTDFETTTFEYASDGITWLAATDGSKVTFAAGTTAIQVRVDSNEDNVVESNETFTLNVANVVSGTVGDTTDTATATISDDDSAMVSISANDPAAGEAGDNGQFTVSITNPASIDTVISYTLSGSATNGGDFSALTGTVTIPAGSTTATIDLSVLDDALVEGPEEITVTLTSITSGDPQISIDTNNNVSSITIVDDDTATWSINGDATVIEGGDATYTVRLSGTLQNGEIASVDLALSDIDTTSGDYADFDAAVNAASAAYSGPGVVSWNGTTLTFTSDGAGAMGDLEIVLSAANDSLVEGAEEYTLALASPLSSTGAAVALHPVENGLTTTIAPSDLAAFDDFAEVKEEGQNNIGLGQGIVSGNVITASGGDEAATSVPMADSGADAAEPGTSLVTNLKNLAAGTSAAVPNGGSATIAGLYGSIEIHDDGSYTYTLDETNPAVDGLAEGETVTEEFVQTVSGPGAQSDTATLTVTIDGTNDGPVVSTPIADQTDQDSAVVSLDISGNFADVDTSDTLTYSATGLPPGLSLDPATGIISGTLDASASSGSTYTVQVTASDGSTSVSDEFIWLVTNPAPTASDNTASLTEDVTLSDSGNLLTDDDTFGIDSDPDGDPLGVANVDGVTDPTVDITGSYGTLDWDADGSYTYTLDNANAAVQALDDGQTITETFSYTVDDGNGGTDTAILTVTINGLNDAPVVASNTITVQEGSVDNSLGLVAPSDGDLEALTVTVTGLPTLGTVTLADDTVVSNGMTLSSADLLGLVYDAPTTYDGSDPGDFTYSVSDGTATVNGNVDFAITRPIATDNTASVTEDGPLADTGNVLTDDDGVGVDSDPESDPLSVTDVDGTPVTGPTVIAGTYGSLAIGSDGSYTYTLDNGLAAVQALDDGETLSDVFTYTMADGKGGTDAADLTVTINGLNDPPLSSDSSVTTGEDTDYTFASTDFSFSDVDTEPLIETRIDSLPIEGVLLLNGNPVSQGDIVSQSDISLGQLVFRPDTDENGNNYASFEFSVSDGSAFVNSPATMTIHVVPVNDDPVAGDDNNVTNENTLLAVSAGSQGLFDNDTDIEGDTLAVTRINGLAYTPSSQITLPSGALLTVYVDGSYDYDPNGMYEPLDDGETASDQFTYKVDDGNGGSDSATVSVTIEGVNDPPTSNNQAGSTDEDTDFTFDLSAFPFQDIEGSDTLAAVRIDSLPTVGTLLFDGNPVSAGDMISPTDISLGLLVFRPEVDEFGNDYATFDFSVSDGDDFSISSATFTVHVRPVNDDPIAVDDSDATDQNTVLTRSPGSGGLLDNDADIDGDSLLIYEINGAAYVPGTQIILPSGTLLTTTADGSYSYDPNGQFNNLDETESLGDSFTYSIDDGHGGRDTAQVFITIHGLNDFPVGGDNSVITSEDTDYPFVLGEFPFTDVDGDSIAEIRIDSLPTDGLLLINGSAAIAGDTISASDVGLGALLFRPDPDEHGSDYATFDFSVGDGDDFTWTPSTMTVHVLPTPDPPVAHDDFSATDEDTVLNVAGAGGLLHNDSDVDGDMLMITTIDGAAYTTGTQITLTSGALLIVDADGSYSYDPNGQFKLLSFGDSTTDAFTYRVDDGTGLTDAAVVTIVIAGLNDPPASLDDGGTTDEATPLEVAAGSGGLLDNDFDMNGDVLSFTAINGQPYTPGTEVQLPSGALLTVRADGSYRYDPNGKFEFIGEGQAGTDTFTYTISDGLGGTGTAMVTITISGLNDPPLAQDDYVVAQNDRPVTVSIKANDSDPDSDPLNVTVLSTPSIGSTVLNPDGTITYDPDPEFRGTVEIDYRIEDPYGEISEATLTIRLIDPFTYDSFNNFSKGHEPDRVVRQEIAPLAPEPIFSGSARPGTQIIGRMYSASGALLGEATSIADVGGNWMMQFRGLGSLDYVRVELQEIAGTNGMFTPNGDIYGYLGQDARDNEYSSLEPWTSYDELYDFTAVYRGSAAQSLSRMHQLNQSPIGFGTRV